MRVPNLPSYSAIQFVFRQLRFSYRTVRLQGGLPKAVLTIPRYAYMRTYTIAFRVTQTGDCCTYSRD